MEKINHLEIRIGEVDDDHITILVMGRMHPKADDYWDGNWLISPIEVAIGGFRGEIPAGLRIDELVRFRETLESVQSSLQGEAVLESMEGWIQLRITVDRRGSLQVIGKVLDQPGSANALVFAIDDLDQTHLLELISALAAAEAKFPIRG